MTTPTTNNTIVQLISDSDHLAAQSKKYGIPMMTSLMASPFVEARTRLIPYAFAKEHSILPVEEVGGVIHVAICDLGNLGVVEEVRHMLAGPISEVLCTKAEIDMAIERCYRQSSEEANEYFMGLNATQGEVATVEDENEYDLLEQRSDSEVIGLFNTIIIQALEQSASDIHFEPVDNGLRVRFRIDGVLQLKHTPPRELQNELVTRIKVIAKLDIAEHRLPQDGRIKLRMGGRSIDFRVSTIPVVFGERIVMRILDRTNISVGLNQIGMGEGVLAQFRKQLKQSQGIVLVTGPTGSGKTTTLYSALTEVESNETNIMTIEDPVEYKFAGMAQIGVNPKIDLNFARGLRSILRQDPDVVMVGEIRDKETADIAIQASLTGHLVLSTLHTNDAPSALTRLVDMGIEPYLLSSSILGVLAQRLVRKICKNCIESYSPLEEECLEIGVTSFKDQTFYRGVGCERCYHTGYKGRHGIYELMLMSSGIKSHLSQTVDSNQIGKIARSDGMTTLRADGKELVLRGITTSSEVIRVTRALDEEV